MGEVVLDIFFPTSASKKSGCKKVSTWRCNGQLPNHLPIVSGAGTSCGALSKKKLKLI